MNIAALDKVTTPLDQPLKQLVTQEIQRQLHLVPRELAQLIDTDNAVTEAMKLLSPLQHQVTDSDSPSNSAYYQRLSTMIADAATLCLIRLVCCLRITAAPGRSH